MRQQGFTLAELLIALAILGVIATFTIPKVLNSSRNEQWNSATKEAAATLSGAFQAYQLNNTINGNETPAMLTSFINYVNIDTVSTVDGLPPGSNHTCTTGNPCLKLHNGGVIYYYSNNFNGTSNLSALNIRFDPDGKLTNGVGDAGKAIGLWIYTNGRITTRGELLPGTINSSASCPCGPSPAQNPDWFSWD